eukprot:15152284-Alexandrium_andersonii.AAC.1
MAQGLAIPEIDLKQGIIIGFVKPGRGRQPGVTGVEGKEVDELSRWAGALAPVVGVLRSARCSQ